MSMLLAKWNDGKQDTLRAMQDNGEQTVVIEHSRGGDFHSIATIPLSEFRLIMQAIQAWDNKVNDAWIQREEDRRDAQADAVSAGWGHD